MSRRIAVANDISGLGNCSMAANLTIFGVMGLQACPIPTAILTNQSCYDVFYDQKHNVCFDDYKNAWKMNHVVLDGIYSGYFPNGKVVDGFTSCFLEENHKTYINDPVMGDLGVPYSNCDIAMIEAMKVAVSHSFVTTPNLTELCMLTDTPFQKVKECNIKEKMAMIEIMAKSLITKGAVNVVVTGIKAEKPERNGQQLYNMIVTATGTKTVARQLLNGDFSGTGDIFSSIVACCAFSGKSIEYGVEKAADFIEKAIGFTNKESETNPNDGICFEQFLMDLIKT